ncbi:MAG: XdhC/CoxI family protein [Megasphaera sp.]|jgi:xanthine dehydrogenase accessory factor|nr:XdhC/CoxI family protein [Megasphaera sp.]MCI1248175.1 XdhC/CoxI family protein [Megasphaera sp.]
MDDLYGDMMNEVFAKLQHELNSHRPAVLLTVVASKESAPRHEGTHQLLLSDSSAAGTIGGGFQEYQACEYGRQCFTDKKSRLVKLKLHPDEEGDIGAVCGGEITVFCQYIAPDLPGAAACLERIAAASDQHRSGWLLLDTSGGDSWAMAVAGDDVTVCGDGASQLWKITGRESWMGRSCGFVDVEGQPLYCEPLFCPGRVLVFGGGHVAAALVPVLAWLGFDCVVIDDRPEFANRERFPAAETIVAGYDTITDRIAITPDDYVCIMTRGHLADYEVQRQVMLQHPCYIGVIGSQGKLAFVRQKLLAAGIPAAAIERCYAPIGVPISAAAPEEIAISIAAELIAVRARHEGRGKASAERWLK